MSEYDEFRKLHSRWITAEADARDHTNQLKRRYGESGMAWWTAATQTERKRSDAIGRRGHQALNNYVRWLEKVAPTVNWQEKRMSELHDLSMDEVRQRRGDFPHSGAARTKSRTASRSRRRAGAR